MMPIACETRVVLCVVWRFPDTKLCGLEICYLCTSTATSLLCHPRHPFYGTPQSRAASLKVRDKPAWMQVLHGSGPPHPTWASGFVSKVAPPEEIV